MKRIEQKNEKVFLYRLLCVLVGVVTLFPVSCNYIMNGGLVTEWITRVAELGAGWKSGHFDLFPQFEGSSGINGLNSSLWFLLPGLLYQLSGKMVFAYRIYMVFVQAGTLLASMLFFRRIFEGEEGRMPALYGMALYMTCPYRIYICYDLANISQATVWMLLPLYLWAALGMIKGRNRWKELLFFAVILAGIGYADTIFFVIAAAGALLSGLFSRKPSFLLGIAAGGLLFAPGCRRLIQYLFLGGFAELDLQLKSIMPYGYRLGYYFNTYVFRDGHPGMGLGMMISLLTGVWMYFVAGQKETHKKDKLFLLGALFFTVLSFYHFPWELVQRMGGWALRLVSLTGTPAVFWGIAQLFLCVPAGHFAGRAGKREEKWAEAVPAVILLACVAVCVYQCNVLTYNRMPLDIL